MIKELLDPTKIVYEDLVFETYALVEGSRVPMLWSDLEEGVLEYDILFKEEHYREKLKTRGPFLIKLDFRTEQGIEESHAIIEQCYGNNSTLFMGTPLLFEEMLQRMREVFYIQNQQENENGILFFYHPHVFRSLVYSYHPERVWTLFRYIHTIWCENDDPQILDLFRWTGKEIVKETIKLKEPL